ncbi:MAG: hypothetical protein KDK89_18045, partial [Alphaproteobacteria bacterium]|nr:hypothetical protein [Alphaproteobacteria bacterium]
MTTNFASTSDTAWTRPILAFSDTFHDTSFFFGTFQGMVHGESERYSRRKYDYVNPMLVFCDLHRELIEEFQDIAIVTGGPVAPYLRQLMRIRERDPKIDPANFPPLPLGHPYLVKNFGLPASRNDTPAARALVKHLLREDVTIHICGHHACHAANAYYSSSFRDALVVTLDGVGFDFVPQSEAVNVIPLSRKIPEQQVYGSVFVCRDNNISLKHQLKAFSIGWMWTRVVTEALGLKDGEEGTAMAMAALGDPIRFRRHIDVDCASYPGPGIQTDDQKARLADWISTLNQNIVTDQDRY